MNKVRKLSVSTKSGEGIGLCSVELLLYYKGTGAFRSV